MKTPVLYNAAPIKTDVKPILSQGDYDVYVGALDEDRFPLYVVINRNTGVVELTNEVLLYVTDWMNHMVTYAAKNEAANDSTFDQLALNLSAAN